MAAHPKSIREIQAEKKKLRELEENKTKVTNLTKQSIPIQIYGKRTKLVLEQSSIILGPKRSVDLPTARLLGDQIKNLRAKGMISTRIVSKPNKVKVEEKKEVKVEEKKVE
jgi:hypothetical protein